MRIEAIFLALALASCAAPDPSATSRQASELTGRTAGPAQRCVLLDGQQTLRISNTDSHMVLYGGGKTVWANDLGPGCGFGTNDLLISEPSGSHYCRGDIVHSVDRYSRIPGPSCVLGEFVPFNR